MAKEKKSKKKEKKPSFISEVRSEMKQVRWPSKKEMIKYSLAVLLCIVVLSLFFVASDLIIAGAKSLVEGL